MSPSYKDLCPEEADEFADVLLAVLSRALQDLAEGWPGMHMREWLAVHLRLFTYDEAKERGLAPNLLEKLEDFHRTLALRAGAEWS